MSGEFLDRPVSAREQALSQASVRFPGDGLRAGFTRPRLEPLASRLERAGRVGSCKQQTLELLADLNASWPCAVFPGVWVSGICVDFLTVTWKGVFLIWSIDYRWTVGQAAMVMPARAEVQRELGEDWPGQVEAVFHSPREGTGWTRHLLVDDESSEPVDIVIMGGRIDELLVDWKPVGEIGLDPEWIRWLCGAARPRWWRSAAGWHAMPDPPAHEQL
jgi:hypothetical protein